MPQNPPTLEETLLRKATSIGPGTSAQNVPDSQFEGQVPNPINMITDLLGDPLGGSSPAMGAASIVSKETPTNLLMELLHKFSREGLSGNPISNSPGLIANDMKTTGFRLPGATKVKAPSGFELPDTMPMRRAPGMQEKLAAQRQADIKVAATNKDVPLDLKKPATNVRSGSAAYGRGIGNSIVNPQIVKAIREMAAQGTPVDAINKAYPQLKPYSINDILKRQSWSWVK